MKRAKSFTKWVSLLISPILALITFVLTYYLDPMKFDEQSSLASIPAFLLSIIILIIGQIISTHIEVEKVSENSERISETVKNYLHITKMGTPNSAWNYIINRLPALDRVQNTSFNFGTENEKTNERLYEKSNYKKSLCKIAKYINSGLIWRDIGDNSALTRFKEINNKISEKNKTNYQFKFIKQSEPQIGFIILTYKDGNIEVLFNWDFRDIPQDPIVLLSRDEVLINMFSAQYNGLWDVAVDNYDDKIERAHLK